ncbi:hypothetical protein Sjap_000679 [Stephania japonica]|uniref:eIF-4F 25 kDa subunit n=1 Tax=Stephania japonica TaxID=461633 RepID=A0AAP0KKB8_9MAGN
MAAVEAIGHVRADDEIPNRVSEDPEEGEIVDPPEHPKSAAAAVAVAPPPPHPLECPWTFWYDNPSAAPAGVPWGSLISAIYTLSTVEEFWSVYNNIRKPSKLANGADLHCFKHEIEPKWEHPKCANGGRWTISLPRGKSDTYWMYTLLAMIGEQFDYGDEICGAAINVRPKQEKIAIWTRNASNKAAQPRTGTHLGHTALSAPLGWAPASTALTMLRAPGPSQSFPDLSSYGIHLLSLQNFPCVLQLSIGRQWKEFLDFNDTIGFIVHEDAKKERAAKSRYSI